MTIIFLRSLMFTSTESRKISTHIAQGLKPSTSPTRNVKAGSPQSRTRNGPNSGSTICCSLVSLGLRRAIPIIGQGNRFCLPLRQRNFNGRFAGNGFARHRRAENWLGRNRLGARRCGVGRALGRRKRLESGQAQPARCQQPAAVAASVHCAGDEPGAPRRECSPIGAARFSGSAFRNSPSSCRPVVSAL